MKNYKDITKKMLKNATPNSHKVKELPFWIINNKIYKVDGKNIILDYSKHEKEIAEWLKNTFGGEIYLCPKVNKPDGIQTPNYIWNNEKWDLKEISGNGKRTIEDAIKKKSLQSNNFIIDISKSKISRQHLIKQVNKLYNSKSTIFINKIIVKRKKFYIIYKKK